MKLGIYFVISAILFFGSPLHAKVSQKPLPPVQVRISPVDADITPGTINPGDIIEFRVSAASSLEVEEMQIAVSLLGGTTLVSGKTSWKGSVGRDEEKSLLLTVRAPEKGTGKIRARVWLPPSDTTRFSSEAQFLLGPDTNTKSSQRPLVKKDSKGRNIIEYR